MSQSSILTCNFSFLYQIDLQPSRPTAQSNVEELIHTHLHVSEAKYPEAIPLKRLDALSAAGSLVEIFSRTGIPAELLTDQGSIFMGKITRNFAVCLQPNITKHLPTTLQVMAASKDGMVH